MEFIFEPPASLIIAALLSIVSVGSAWRGTRLFFKGLRKPDHPSGPLLVVRGIRGWIVALALSAMTAGVLYNKGWPLIIGLIFLGEELFETGVVSLALRAGRKAARRDRSL